jgi:pyruvate dehydrogenase E2 component (dihydrolipoamide acetyltransferase)
MAMSRGEIQIVEPTVAERTIGRRAAESRATIPQLELGVEVEMDAAVSLGASSTAVVLRAYALALRETPRANGAYRDGRFELYSRVNVAVVIGAQAPTVFDADTKAIEALEAELTSLRERGERGELTSPELSSATATLTDLGPLGIDRPSIVPVGGQTAIAVGAIRQRPVVREAAIVPGQIMQLMLVCDHRILYGVAAAEFTARIKQLLEEPSNL